MIIKIISLISLLILLKETLGQTQFTSIPIMNRTIFFNGSLINGTTIKGFISGVTGSQQPPNPPPLGTYSGPMPPPGGSIPPNGSPLPPNGSPPPPGNFSGPMPPPGGSMPPNGSPLPPNGSPPPPGNFSGPMPPPGGSIPPYGSPLPPNGSPPPPGNFSGPMPPPGGSIAPNGSPPLPNGSPPPPGSTSKSIPPLGGNPSQSPPALGTFTGSRPSMAPTKSPPQPAGSMTMGQDNGFSEHSTEDDYEDTTDETVPNENYLVITIPSVIDSSNIASVLQSGQLTASDVTKISPEALSTPSVLETLKTTDMDASMESAIKSKVADMLSSLPFNPDIYATCGKLVSPKSINILSDDQALSIVKSTNYQPDENTVAAYGAKIGNMLSGVTSDKIEGILKNAQKVLGGVDPVQFGGMLDKVKITEDFLSNLKDADLTDKQSRDVYEKFKKDSAKNPENQTSADILKFASSLPSSVRQAIKADDVKNISPNDASTALESLAPPPSGKTPKPADVGTEPSSPSPTLFVLLDKMKDFTNSKVINLLLDNNLLTVKTISTIGKLLCPIISNISRVDAAISTPVLAAALDVCRTDLGQFGKAGSKEYGVLARVVSPSDIINMPPLNALNTVIPRMCNGQLNLAQVKATLNVLEPYFNETKSLGNHYKKITCFLPFLSNFYALKDKATIDSICQIIACQKIGSFHFSSFKTASKFCTENSPPRNLFCKGQGTSSILDSMPFSTFNQTFNRAIVLENLDLLQSAIFDCTTRNYIYSLIKPYNLTNANNIAKLGSLMDQLSAQELQSINKAYVCGFLQVFKKIYANWDAIYDAKANAELKTPDWCARDSVIKFLMNADISAQCTGSSPGRKKRQTASLTCNQIKQLGSNVVTLDAAQFSTLSNTEFSNCVNILNKIFFLEDQLTALVNVAKKVYGNDVSQWTTEAIISMGSLCSGLKTTELESLNLNKIEAVTSIMVNGHWTVPKLAAVFKSIKTNLLMKPIDLSGVTPAQLKSMGEAICGATAVDIVTLNPTAFCDALQNVGRVKLCESNQLEAFGKVFKGVGCLNTAVDTWKASDITALGNLIGGLTKTDLSKLSTLQIQAIPYTSIYFISPINFNGFSLAQLKSLSAQQAAIITKDQFNSLDPNKQDAVKSLLSTYGSNLSVDLNSIKNGANTMQAVSFLMSTIVLLTTYIIF